MKTAEIKRRYLAHFEANGHTVVPSAPLPAIDDPNLLFINAGMVQFVPYFLGQRTAPYKSSGLKIILLSVAVSRSMSSNFQSLVLN